MHKEISLCKEQVVDKENGAGFNLETTGKQRERIFQKKIDQK